jgi:hypothetical protein
MEDPLSASFFLSLLIITIRFFWGGIEVETFFRDAVAGI